jgi:hypothetical protein
MTEPEAFRVRPNLTGRTALVTGGPRSQLSASRPTAYAVARTVPVETSDGLQVCVH